VRAPLALLLAVCVLHPPQARAQESPTLSESQIRELIRASADKDVENTKRQRDYTYIQRNEEKRLDGSGRMKSSEIKTYEVMVLSGDPVQKLIAKDDRALSEKEARKEEEKIQKLVAKYQKESERDRKRRIGKAEKATEEDRQFVREIADAYRFRLVGIEPVDGRETYAIDADPLPGYKPRLKDARILPKMRFRVWIDRAESQWVKLDIETIDTISFGLFLARVRKGSKMAIEQTRVNDEVWLPKHFGLKFDARLALLKSMNLSIDVTFRDYKKFSTNSTIRPIGEAPAR